MLLHQFPKLGTQRHDGASVATHISEGDARDDAAGTDGDVVHVAPGLTRPERRGMDPDPQARQICDSSKSPGYRPMSRRTSNDVELTSIPNLLL